MFLVDLLEYNLLASYLDSMFLVDLLEYNLLASYLDQGPKNVPQDAFRTLSFLPTSTSRCSLQPSLR